MAIRSFDHTGFVVEDIPRAHKFYEGLFGARPLHIANLKTRAYTGWPIISFVQMGLRRFELCLAQHPLPPAGPSRRRHSRLSRLALPRAIAGCGR